LTIPDMKVPHSATTVEKRKPRIHGQIANLNSFVSAVLNFPTAIKSDN